MQIFNFHICHQLLFHSLKGMFHIPSPTTYGILQNYYFFPVMPRLILDHEQSIKTQCFAPYAKTKLTEGFSNIWHLPAPRKTAMHNVIKLGIYQPNSSCKKFLSLYHLEMSSTWHWNCQNYYPTCSSLWTSKSSLCCWKILLHLQTSFLHLLC